MVQKDSSLMNLSRGNLVTKVPQEISSPKMSHHYKKALGYQYAGNCPSENYLVTLTTFFQNEKKKKKKGIGKGGRRRRGRRKGRRGARNNKEMRKVIWFLCPRSNEHWKPNGPS